MIFYADTPNPGPPHVNGDGGQAAGEGVVQASIDRFELTNLYGAWAALETERLKGRAGQGRAGRQGTKSATRVMLIHSIVVSRYVEYTGRGRGEGQV